MVGLVCHFFSSCVSGPPLAQRSKWGFLVPGIRLCCRCRRFGAEDTLALAASSYSGACPGLKCLHADRPSQYSSSDLLFYGFT